MVNMFKYCLKGRNFELPEHSGREMLSAAQTGLKYIIPILYTKFLLFASEIAYIFRGDTLFFGDAAQDCCLMERLTAFMRKMCVFSGIFSVFRAKFNVFDQKMSEI